MKNQVQNQNQHQSSNLNNQNGSLKSIQQIRQKQFQYESPNHLNIVEGFNDAAQISNYNCQWIQNQQSPYKVVNQSFPSDIQIGLDGVNIGSRHHIQQRQIQMNFPNDLSINNQQLDQNFLKTKSKNQLNDKSYLSSKQQNKNNGNILNDQLNLLNDSKENQNSWLSKSRQKSQNLFDVQNKVISQIQIQQNNSELLNQISKNSHNQNNNLSKPQFTKNNNQKLSIQRQSDGSNVLQQKSQTDNSKQLNLQNSSLIKSQKQQNTSKSSQEKQKTITINQESFNSKIYDDLNLLQQTKMLKSMSNYLHTNQKIYKQYYQKIQFIYNDTKTKNSKSIQHYYMYADFFKQKSKQFQKYLRQVQSQKNQKLYQNLQQKEINNLVYVDSKIVLRDIHQKSIKKAKIYREFYKQIVQMNNDLRKIIAQIFQKRTTLQKSIQSSILFIKQLQKQLQKLIQYRLNYQKNRLNPNFYIDLKALLNGENTHILKDHYLQIRYIIQKQSLYLRKLKSLKVKFIKYLTQIYLNDQVILGSKIKQYLINYTEMLIQAERQENVLISSNSQSTQAFIQNKTLISIKEKKQKLQNKKINQTMKRQSYHKLLSCIPLKVQQQIGLNQNILSQNVQQLLEQLNCHFQNQVFLPIIQMDSQFIFYKTEGAWYSRDQFKTVSDTQNSFSSETKSHINNNSSIRNELNIVLSINKYLHMEQNQKIATLKLNQIKISKKNRYIIISDRGKGIVGFLVNNGNELGRIQMKSSQEADLFANKIKQLIETK